MPPPPLRLPAILLALVASTGIAQATPWAGIATPAPGAPEAIGGPSNGCVAGARALPHQGRGYVSIRRHRNRFYGHPDTLDLVQDLGQALAARTSRVLLVGDLSQPRGGRMPSSHRSHQNGLDVDLWLALSPSAAAALRGVPEEKDPPSMVAPGGERVNKGFGEHQRFLLRAAATDPRVERIFVNPAIKRALCETEPGDRTWLRKLRAWWGHDAHVHVRLACPPESPECNPQAPVPAGEGCGAELAWWFSEEARSPRKASKPRADPAMPAACRRLLAGQ